MEGIKSNEFYIYGYGIYGSYILALLKKANKKPLAIFDKSETGKIDGINIAHYKDFNLKTNLPVLVTTLGYPEVENKLDELGFKNQIHPLDLFKLIPESIEMLVDDKFMWRNKIDSFSISKKERERLLYISGDVKTKLLIEQILEFRERPTYLNYPHCEDYPMYFPEDIKGLYTQNNLRVLDIGAYDGDTLSDFIETFPQNLREYCCIEANPLNIQKLSKKIEQNKNSSLNIEIIEGAVGVDDSSEYITISDMGSVSGIVSSNSLGKWPKWQTLSSTQTSMPRENSKAFKVKVLDIKEIVSSKKPNIIKMDIEGCDFNALKEMTSYIVESSPILALSIYHQPKDLWEMPLYIDEVSNGNYEIYIRQEGHWGLETQLYAIPM